MSYFQHPSVSNSRLSQFAKELKGDYSPEPFEAYRFGSLFDAVVTEPHALDRIRLTLGDYTYQQHEIEHADKMRSAFMKDTFCADLVQRSKMQVEKYADVTIRHDDVLFHLPMKCKYDFLTDNFFADLKSTTATTQAQFEAACEQFGYWRQCAIYGQLGNLRKSMFIGVSKTNFKIFKVPLLVGDPRWQAGAKQFRELAFKYWLLK